MSEEISDVTGKCAECNGTGIVGSDPWGKRYSDEWHSCECQTTEPPKYAAIDAAKEVRGE